MLDSIPEHSIKPLAQTLPYKRLKYVIIFFLDPNTILNRTRSLQKRTQISQHNPEPADSYSSSTLPTFEGGSSDLPLSSSPLQPSQGVPANLHSSSMLNPSWPPPSLEGGSNAPASSMLCPSWLLPLATSPSSTYVPYSVRAGVPLQSSRAQVPHNIVQPSPIEVLPVALQPSTIEVVPADSADTGPFVESALLAPFVQECTSLPLQANALALAQVAVEHHPIRQLMKAFATSDPSILQSDVQKLADSLVNEEITQNLIVMELKSRDTQDLGLSWNVGKFLAWRRFASTWTA